MELTLIEMFRELDNSSKRHLMRCVVDNMVESDDAEHMLEFIIANLGEGDAQEIIEEMHGKMPEPPNVDDQFGMTVMPRAE
jgi:hypothetical protein